MSLAIIPKEYRYPKGIRNLHESLRYALYDALRVVKKYYPDAGKTYDSQKCIDVFVDFKERQPANAVKGYFVFDGVVYRFLSIVFDYALLLQARSIEPGAPTVSGCKIEDIKRMVGSRNPVCFRFEFHSNGANNDDSLIITTNSVKTNDDIGMPFHQFDDVKMLSLTNIPPKLTNTQYTLVGEQYYAKYATKKESYCALYAQLDNEYDECAIKVLRWIPKTRDRQFCEVRYRSNYIRRYEQLEDRSYYMLFPKHFDLKKKNESKEIFDNYSLTDSFFEWGYISRQENAELHSFMVKKNSRILFGKCVDNKISLIGGINMFLNSDFIYPICLTKIPVQ